MSDLSKIVAAGLLLPAVVLATVPASARCRVVGFSNGEALYETTSDGNGHPYRPLPSNTKIIGNIEVTTTTSAHANGSRVLMRSPEYIRRRHHWY